MIPGEFPGPCSSSLTPLMPSDPSGLLFPTTTTTHLPTHPWQDAAQGGLWAESWCEGEGQGLSWMAKGTMAMGRMACGQRMAPHD